MAQVATSIMQRWVRTLAPIAPEPGNARALGRYLRTPAGQQTLLQHCGVDGDANQPFRLARDFGLKLALGSSETPHSVSALWRHLMTENLADPAVLFSGLTAVMECIGTELLLANEGLDDLGCEPLEAHRICVLRVTYPHLATTYLAHYSPHEMFASGWTESAARILESICVACAPSRPVFDKLLAHCERISDAASKAGLALTDGRELYALAQQVIKSSRRQPTRVRESRSVKFYRRLCPQLAAYFCLRYAGDDVEAALQDILQPIPQKLVSLLERIAEIIGVKKRTLGAIAGLLQYGDSVVAGLRAQAFTDDEIVALCGEFLRAWPTEDAALECLHLLPRLRTLGLPRALAAAQKLVGGLARWAAQDGDTDRIDAWIFAAERGRIFGRPFAAVCDLVGRRRCSIERLDGYCDKASDRWWASLQTAMHQRRTESAADRAKIHAERVAKRGLVDAGQVTTKRPVSKRKPKK